MSGLRYLPGLRPTDFGPLYSDWSPPHKVPSPRSLESQTPPSPFPGSGTISSSLTSHVLWALQPQSWTPGFFPPTWEGTRTYCIGSSPLCPGLVTHGLFVPWIQSHPSWVLGLWPQSFWSHTTITLLTVMLSCFERCSTCGAPGSLPMVCIPLLMVFFQYKLTKTPTYPLTMHYRLCSGRVGKKEQRHVPWECKSH